MNEQDQLIERFITVTNSSRYLAEQYLSRNNNDLMNAIEDYFASNSSSKPAPRSSAKKPSGIQTFRDLNTDDEDDDKTDTNFFTGGEKSGLQVEDPNKDERKSGRLLIEDIFQRAREQADQPDDRVSATQTAPKFTGSGFKLGDGESPSQVVPDPSANRPRRLSLAKREIVFWKQGFTIGDGPLLKYDDPENAAVLEELNRGRVPVSLLNVEFGQDVDVSVIKKTDEDYVPPKRKVGGFGGSGHRLGLPVPGEALAPSTNEPAPVSQPVEPVADAPEPSGDTPVQIRFANGSRVRHVFNSLDPVSVVYDFVRNHQSSDALRPFILSHAFPVKAIEESGTVAEAKLKNAVVVQRWS